MKKLVLIILVLLFAFGIVACADDNISDSLYGSWEAEISNKGLTDKNDEGKTYLTFDDNGIGSYVAYTADITENHIHEYFNFEINGDILAISVDSCETIECKYTMENDALIIKYNDNTFEYTRSEY